MSRTAELLDQKYTTERYALSVNFSPSLLPGDRVDAVRPVDVEVVVGEDPDPGSVVTEAPTSNRLCITQMLEAGLGGCTYRITITVDTLLGETHTVVVDLPVIEP